MNDELTVKEIVSHKPDAPDFIVKEWIRTEFNLPVALRSLCDECYLRVWEGPYVIKQMQEMIVRGFVIHWQSVPSVVSASKKVAVSFRRYKDKSYAVVKVWDKEVEVE